MKVLSFSKILLGLSLTVLGFQSASAATTTLSIYPNVGFDSLTTTWTDTVKMSSSSSSWKRADFFYSMNGGGTILLRAFVFEPAIPYTPIGSSVTDYFVFGEGYFGTGAMNYGLSNSWYSGASGGTISVY